MEFSQFIVWSFYSLISACFIYGVNLLSKLNASVATLNTQFAVLLEKHDNQETHISELKHRLVALETVVHSRSK